MKNSKPNVAAGRLGELSLAAPSSQSGGRHQTSYGTGRLGIVADTESCETETQVPAAEPQDVPQVSPAEPPAHAWMPEQPAPEAQPDWDSQPAESLAPEPEPPAEDIPAAASSADSWAWPAWAVRARSWLPDGPRGGLALAGAAACVMLVVLVLVWWFSDETMDPQQAAASPQSTAVTGAATARPRPETSSPPAPPGNPANASLSRDRAGRKNSRIVFSMSARPARPRRRPQDTRPKHLVALLKGKPAAAKPPRPGSTSRPSARAPASTRRPTATTTTRPASASRKVPRRPGTTTRPAAAPPPSRPPGPPPAIHVSCVMKGPRGPSAIINGCCVTVGDTIGGARIVAIGQFTVEVEHKGHRHFIGVSATGTPAPAPADEEPDATEGTSQDQDDASEEE